MATLELERLLPVETDYPGETFHSDLPPEMRVGCAAAYFKTNPLARRLFHKRVQIVFELIPSRKYDRALDAGTGAGFLLPALASVAREVDGVDLSPVLSFTKSMLKRRGIDNVTLQEADLMHLPFDDDAFDLAVCMSVMEHIPEPADAFREMGRVLRPGSVMIVGYPLEHPVFKSMEWLLRKELHLRAFLSGRGAPKGKAFHPHVTHYADIERAAESVFRIDVKRDIRLMGIPVYRILRLTS
jgi:ubiquinone/menaquinone biosynthesis C-methylase UbiE